MENGSWMDDLWCFTYWQDWTSCVELPQFSHAHLFPKFASSQDSEHLWQIWEFTIEPWSGLRCQKETNLGFASGFCRHHRCLNIFLWALGWLCMCTCKCSHFILNDTFAAMKYPDWYPHSIFDHWYTMSLCSIKSILKSQLAIPHEIPTYIIIPFSIIETL